MPEKKPHNHMPGDDPLDLGDILGGGASETEDVDLASVLGDSPGSGAAENPLDGVEYTGSVEEDAVSEAEALGDSFKARARREQKRFRDATSSEYYSVLCFQTEGQKEAFLDILRIARSGRPHFQKYIDARKFAAAINRLVDEGRRVELPDPDITYRETGSDRKLNRLT